MTQDTPSIDKILEQQDDNALISQALKYQVRVTSGWYELNVAQKEAIDVIFLKISRILSGQANFEGHWLDIADCARLGKESIHA